MFNWSTVPTFGVMLLFWLLAAYVLTRSPRGLVPLAAAGAQIATAAYLLGQGMQANAANVAEWRPWARNLIWGATLAPSLWYWLTLLLLREQEAQRIQGYLRRAGYPLGLLFGAASLLFTAAIYIDDWLFVWSAPGRVAPGQVIYSHYHLREGRLYAGFAALLVGTTLGAVFNLWLGWRNTTDPERRRRFAWLLFSAALFLVGANTLGIASSLNLVDDRAIGVSHLALGAAMLAMAWNVAAYSLLLRGQVIRTDLLYFLTSLAVICATYAVVFVVLAGPDYSFQLLRLLVVTLILIILANALLDLGRQLLDRLFYSGAVQRLRSNLSSTVQDAALTPDLGTVLSQAEEEIREVSAEHFLRLTEQALRRLNNPATLAECGLLAQIPRTLATTGGAAATPLEQAQRLRETVRATIERLRPAELEAGPGAPGALQYTILREEYLLGMPNKQIMTRRSISESTFHRNRREAIAALAREFARQEALLSQEKIGSF